jgi:protoheme IX farnesyltransferase
MGNLLATAGAFLLASKGDVNSWLFLATMLGLGLIIASACVFNNCIDRDIDKKMARTKKRALVQGTVSVKKALVFATTLGIAGALVLGIFTNFLTLAIALTGLFTYVVLYGIGKRRSIYGTHVGSIAGAIPPVVGYCAVSNRLNLEASILFLVLVFWQMPHFFAIAIYRLQDYKAAGIPVWPLKKGLLNTKFQITAYMLAFSTAVLSLAAFHYTGRIYLVAMGLICLYWLRLAADGFRASDDARWARKVFGRSLLVLMAFCLMISIGAVLP